MEGRKDAADLFDQILQHEEEAAVSTISIYEIIKHGLHGSIAHDLADQITEEALEAFVIAGTDTPAVLRRAASLSHGTDLSMADSLIAASLEEVGCTSLHTTDTDFRRYKGLMQIILL